MKHGSTVPLSRMDCPADLQEEQRQSASVVRTLLETNPQITPISPEDRTLFSQFFSETPDSLYAEAWAYLTQAVNGHRYGFPLGLKNHHEGILAVIGFFPRPAATTATWHFHIVHPMGNWMGREFLMLCQELRELGGTPVYLKKINADQESWLLQQHGFKSIEALPWHGEATAEDDTFPEVVLNSSDTLQLVDGPGRNEVKDHYRRFLNRYKGDTGLGIYTPAIHDQARDVVGRFFEHLEEKQHHLSVPDDYENMITALPAGVNGKDYFAYILHVNGQRGGFCLAERTGPTHAGVYANIALHSNFPYASEYLVVELIRKMYAAGITSVNLGGSETRGLDTFKRKFRPESEVQMHWVVYDP